MQRATRFMVFVGTVGFVVPCLAAPEATLDQQYERLWSEENYAAAEPVAQERVDESLRTHGPHHATTAWTLRDLAETFARQGKDAEAEQAYRRALVAGERALGPDNPHNVEFILGLANACRAQGRPADARLHLQHALALQEKATASVLTVLADFHRQEKDHAKAEALLVRAVTIYEQSLGTESPATVSCRESLEMLRQSRALSSRYADDGLVEGDTVPLRPRRPAPTGDSEPRNPFDGPPDANPFAEPAPAEEPDAEPVEPVPVESGAEPQSGY